VNGTSLDAVIRAYQQRPFKKGAQELAGFREEPTVEAAVSRAGLAQRSNGKRLVRFNHQRRVPRQALELAREQLLATDLKSSGSFHELFLTVKTTIGGIPGIGELMVYDTALRIGARLGLEPERVYLHAGTRVGARRLGLDWRAKWIERKDLPKALRALPPWQVEDILCIYKDRFAGVPDAGRSC